MGILIKVNILFDRGHKCHYANEIITKYLSNKRVVLFFVSVVVVYVFLDYLLQSSIESKDM